MTTPQPVRGTQSLLGEDADRLAKVVETFDHVRGLFGFKRVEVPTIENMSVFARTMGETTDVVSKEMYTFEDKGGDFLALRPEFTAGICRAYLSEGWQQYTPLKVATQGSAFRYERPQKGRHREFHQLDVEVIGAAEAAADVELLAFADKLLRELKIHEGVTLQLNTLGDAETRGSWRSALVTYFERHKDQLSHDCQSRLYKNPLRILDSKDPRDRAIVESAPDIDMYLTAEAGHFLSDVERGLEAAGVEWKRNARLVRGLDYYRHTVFEFVTDRLGAQGALIAGGRYDGLIELLGGPHTPAVGWAAGIERLAMMIEPPQPEAPELILIPDSDEDLEVSLALLRLLRDNCISADIGFSGSSKKRYEKAKKGTAHRALTVTSDVDAYAVVRLRDLKEGSPPIRSKLREALERHFTVHEDEHRAFTLVHKA